MPDSADLQTVDEFEGGDPELREHANKVVRALNACIAKLTPGGGGSGGSSSSGTVQLVGTVREDDGSIKLRFVNLDGTLGEEINSDSQLG